MLRFKIETIVLILTMALGVLAGCSSNQQTVQKANASSQPAAQQATGQKLSQGLGQIPLFRVGPGKDKKEVQVYSFTYLTASAIFDKDGKIVNLYYDALEVSTPNYDGESMPHFSGWPGIQGYNVTDHKTGQVSGVSNNTNETVAAEINGWKTKRERGDAYGMNKNNDWYKQTDAYQKFFTGKTVAQIEAWFAKNTSDVNGRPLKADAKDEKDKAKYSKLSDQEKKVLADVVTGATMSLKDAHSDFIGVLKKAYENRKEITLPQ